MRWSLMHGVNASCFTSNHFILLIVYDAVLTKINVRVQPFENNLSCNYSLDDVQLLADKELIAVRIPLHW